MALLFKTDGSIIKIQLKEGCVFTLEELQALVGGFIEMHEIENNVLVILNEEGKINGLPINERATSVFKKDFQGDILHGDVIAAEKKEVG